MQQIEWIDYYITGLIETYGTNDVYELYDCLEIIIRRLDPENILLEGNEAFYYRDYYGVEVVFIRYDLNHKYEKFILAHELAHAIIHTDAYTAAYDKRLINQGKLDQQAHYFAIRLLGLDPHDIQYEGFSIDQLASVFCVPSEYLSKVIG